MLSDNRVYAGFLLGASTVGFLVAINGGLVAPAVASFFIAVLAMLEITLNE